MKVIQRFLVSLALILTGFVHAGEISGDQTANSLTVCNSDKLIVTRINYPEMTIRDCSKDSCQPNKAISMWVTCNSTMPYSYDDFFKDPSDCKGVDAVAKPSIVTDRKRQCFNSLKPILDNRLIEEKGKKNSYAIKHGVELFIMSCVWKDIACDVFYKDPSNRVRFSIPYQYFNNNYENLLSDLVKFYKEGSWNEQH